MIRIPIRRWVREAWAEVRAAGAITPWLGRRFWYCWAVALVAPLPACWFRSPVQAVLSVAGFLLVGVLMVRSGWSARWVRSAGWVRYPNGPAVVAHLSKLLPVLLLPQFLLGMTAAFFQVGALVPDSLPVSSLADAARLTADNVLRSQLFFDAAECFHFRLGADPSRLAGPTLVFVGRLLLDLTVIKLLVELAVGAASRARGLGDATDRLSAIDEAVKASDWPRVSRLARGVAANLEAAAMDFRTHLSPDDPHPGEAWNGLCHLREFALEAVRKRLLLADDAERAELQGLYRRLEPVTAPPVVPPAGPLPLGGLVAIPLCVGSVVTLLAFLPGGAGLVGASLGVILLLGLLLGSRGVIRRLSGRGRLRPVAPERLSIAIGIWSAALLPGLLLGWARVWELFPHFAPVFGPTTAPPGFTDALLFVVQGLLHTQILVDVFEVYNIRVARLEQVGWAGSSLAWVMRLGFDLGILSVVLAPGVGWLRRVLLRSRVRPGLDLAIRRAALSADPGADRLVARDLGYLREYFLHAFAVVGQNVDGVDSLAAGGFLRDWQKTYQPATEPDLSAARGHLLLGERLAAGALFDEAEGELTRTHVVLKGFRNPVGLVIHSEASVILAAAEAVRYSIAVERARWPRPDDEYGRTSAALSHRALSLMVVESDHRMTVLALKTAAEWDELSLDVANAARYWTARAAIGPERILRTSEADLPIQIRRCREGLGALPSTHPGADLAAARGRRRLGWLLSLAGEPGAARELQSAESYFGELAANGDPMMRYERLVTRIARVRVSVEPHEWCAVEEAVAELTQTLHELEELARHGVDEAADAALIARVRLGVVLGCESDPGALAALGTAAALLRERLGSSPVPLIPVYCTAQTELATLHLAQGDAAAAVAALCEAGRAGRYMLWATPGLFLAEVLPAWEGLWRELSSPGAPRLAEGPDPRLSLYETFLSMLAVPTAGEDDLPAAFKNRVSALLHTVPPGAAPPELLLSARRVWCPEG